MKGNRQAKHRTPHTLGHAQRSHLEVSYDDSCASRAHHRKTIDHKFHILQVKALSGSCEEIRSHKDLSTSNAADWPLLQISSNLRSKLPRLRKPRLKISQLIPPSRISRLVILKSIIARLYALELH